MAKQSDFDSFLSNIEPSATTVSYISSVQNTLRDYLANHSTYKDIHIQTFLSGSYAKHTSIRPKLYDGKRDVDIVVETNHNSSDSSCDVLQELLDVLLEKSTYSNAKLQSHSVGIELEGIEIDVVPVVRNEDGEIFCIGTSDVDEWILTDPKGHKKWSSQVNADNNQKYKPLVKMQKWWRRTNCPDDVKYPKGLALEKIIADNLGDSSLNTEDFLIASIQNIIAAYKEDFVNDGINPVISDPSDKIENNDLLSGYTVEDFSSFVLKLEEHAGLLNEEGLSNDTWRKILGIEFPNDSNTTSSLALANVQKCITAPHRQRPIWAIQRGGAAFVSVSVLTDSGEVVAYQNNEAPLEKGCSLRFKALTGIKHPYKVKWQIVNTGDEAQDANCLRGSFEESDDGFFGKCETTQYSGTHSVQCFIIKYGVCVAMSKEFIVNIR